MNDMNSLAHTSWNCKYHIVFAPKYRRKAFYGEKREEVGKILLSVSDTEGLPTIALVSNEPNNSKTSLIG